MVAIAEYSSLTYSFIIYVFLLVHWLALYLLKPISYPSYGSLYVGFFAILSAICHYYGWYTLTYWLFAVAIFLSILLIWQRILETTESAD